MLYVQESKKKIYVIKMFVNITEDIFTVTPCV